MKRENFYDPVMRNLYIFDEEGEPLGYLHWGDVSAHGIAYAVRKSIPIGLCEAIQYRERAVGYISPVVIEPVHSNSSSEKSLRPLLETRKLEMQRWASTLGMDFTYVYSRWTKTLYYLPSKNNPKLSNED